MAKTTAHYFAYGPDLRPGALERLVPTAQFLSPGRARGFRLAFVPSVDEHGSPLLVPIEHMCAWGGIFELDQTELARLPSHEAGALELIDVFPWKGPPVTCFALVGAAPEREAPPRSAALTAITEGLERHEEFPSGYRKFIDSIKTEPAEAFRAGLLVIGHRKARGQPGLGLLRIDTEVANRLGLGRFAVVLYRERPAIVAVQRLDDGGSKPPVCQLNQNIRHALGIIGRETYGATVSVHPVGQPVRRLPLVMPRSLCLPLYRPSWLDSEKNIVVLHPRAIQLLGLYPGDYARLRVAVRATDAPQENDVFEVRSISLRVFPGTDAEVWRAHERITYPQPNEIYIDAYGRRALGLDRHDQGTPVTVTADVGRLFLGRLVFYAATLLLSFIALQPLADAIGNAAAVLLGVVITALVSLFDLRARVQY